MMKPIILAALLATTAPAFAADTLTAADIPAILEKLQGCEVKGRGILSGSYSICTAKGTWIAVHDDRITIFYKGSNGLEVTGGGRDLGGAVQDLARQINGTNADGKRALETLAPFLPTQ